MASGRGRVTAVGAQRSGDVGGAGQAQRADGEVAQGRHGAGQVAGAGLGGIFSKRHVTHMVQAVFDHPVPANVAGELGRAGGAESKARHGVHGDGAPPAAAWVTHTAGDLQGLGGVGEVEFPDAGDLEGAQLDPAVGVVAAAVHNRDFVPWQPDELGVQRWLVRFDDEQVVGMLAGHEELSVVALGVQCISGDKGAGKVKAFQERLELRDLVGGAGNITLGEHHTVVVVQCCQQVHRGTVVGCRAAQALAVDRQDAALSPAW
jgi:hypothetical protein